jgi:hypothetical protein
MHALLVGRQSKALTCVLALSIENVVILTGAAWLGMYASSSCVVGSCAVSSLGAPMLAPFLSIAGSLLGPSLLLRAKDTLLLAVSSTPGPLSGIAVAGRLSKPGPLSLREGTPLGFWAASGGGGGPADERGGGGTRGAVVGRTGRVFDDDGPMREGRGESTTSTEGRIEEVTEGVLLGTACI